MTLISYPLCGRGRPRSQRLRLVSGCIDIDTRKRGTHLFYPFHVLKLSHCPVRKTSNAEAHADMIVLLHIYNIERNVYHIPLGHLPLLCSF